MKEQTYLLMALLLSCSMMFSCSDSKDEPGPGPEEVLDPDKVNGTYGRGSNLLALTYGGEELSGKLVSFQASDKEKATITLEAVIPGEASTVLSDVELTGTETQFSFGTATTHTATGWELTYKGVMTEGRLQLDIDVKMPANDLVGRWELDDLYINWKTSFSTLEALRYPLLNVGGFLPIYPSSIGTLLGLFPGGVLSGVLQSVTFHADGNITAEYKKADRDDFETSPLNLVHYYVTEEDGIQVLLNPTALLSLIDLSDVISGGASIDIVALLNIFSDLLVEGIPLGISFDEGNNLQVYLPQELTLDILSNDTILDMLSSLDVSINMNDAQVKLTFNVNNIPKIVEKTTLLEVGLKLNSAEG